MDTHPDTPDRPLFRKAVTWAYAMTLGQRGISMLLTFILAALLGPGDFGTVAMAMAYILLIEMFVAQGMSTAIIQRKDLAGAHLDAVFWLTLAAGIILAALSAALSGWWAAVNDLPELGPVIVVLSLSLPIKGLTVVQHALLQRRMDFRTLALLSGASSIVGGGAGVTMAVLGCGVWSLVAQQLITSALATTIMWAMSEWRPRLRFSLPHVRQLLGFSGGAFAAQLGAYLAGQADAILMGLFFGPLAVGLYRLADRLMRTLLEIATRSIQIISLPHFSGYQDAPADLRRAVLSCIRHSAMLTLPAMALLAVTSDSLMALMGERWSPAADVMKVLVVMGMTKAIVLFTGPLLFAMSRPRTVAVLTWGLGLTTAAGIAAAGILTRSAAVQHQIMAIAGVRVAIFLVPYAVICVVILHRLCDIPLRSLAGAIRLGAAAGGTVIALAVAIGRVPHFDALPAVGRLLTLALPAAIGAALVVLLLDRPLRRDVTGALWAGRRHLQRRRQAGRRPLLQADRPCETVMNDA